MGNNFRRAFILVSQFVLIFALISSFVITQGSSGTKTQLPTGVSLEPAGRSVDVGNMPLAMKFSPDKKYVVLALNGWRQQGIQVVELATGKVVQTLEQPSAFLGLAFSPSGSNLFVSGANEDAVFRYKWQDGQATLQDKIVLADKQPKKDGTRFPAGLAVSRDGRHLYVAENIADTVAVIDLDNNSIVQRLKTDHYPYEVTVASDNKIYVSSWGSQTVTVFNSKHDGSLTVSGKIIVGRHPSAMLLSDDGNRLFVISASTDRVAVVDTRTNRVIKHLADSPPSGTLEGSTPNALALSPDGKRLFVAEADNNAVAVFDLGRVTAGKATGRTVDKMVGRIPCGWYPTALLTAADSLIVANGKGRGTAPNSTMRQPNVKLSPNDTDYTLGQLNGTLTFLPLQFSAAELQDFTRQVAELNNWNRTRTVPSYPPFKHVIYIIKENRTYDQMFGDMPEGDGDRSLLYYPKEANPNHRAIVQRFGLFDRFFVNAEVSQQGHPWSTSAYVTDYTEKTTPAIYSHRRATPDDEGETDDPVAGFLWDSAIKKGLTLRNYGEYGEQVPGTGQGPGEPARYRATKALLDKYTNHEYPSFDLNIPDQTRADVWLKEFQHYVETGTMPSLEIMHLPSDHSAGGRAGEKTPRAYMADNDLALGRLVEAVSKSRYWQDTVFFVLEDDAQDGPDHVDSHRSVLMAISAYNRGGTLDRFVNTTDVVATIEEILGMQPLSQFDRFGKPLREIFADKPNLNPYVAITPAQSMTEKNPAQGSVAEDSKKLDLHKEDMADMDLFNRILWRAIKGESVPYPGTKRMTSLDYIRSR